MLRIELKDRVVWLSLSAEEAQQVEASVECVRMWFTEARRRREREQEIGRGFLGLGVPYDIASEPTAEYYVRSRDVGPVVEMARRAMARGQLAEVGAFLSVYQEFNTEYVLDEILAEMRTWLTEHLGGKAVSPVEAAPAATEEAVSKCFRHPSAFVKDKVAEVVRSFYTGAHAELALIEIALFDHRQLKKRNAHTDFVKALVAWDVLPTMDDAELQKMKNGISDKYRNLPKSRYEEWGDDYLNDKISCTAIGKKIDDAMKYHG